MMIARKSILNKSKLSSGASLVSTTPWRYTESSKMTARISFLVDAQKLIQYNITRPSHLTFAHQLEMNVRGAPARLPVKKWPWVATSPVALQNTPKKATRSTSTKHSRIICCEIFGLKYPMQSLHRCHLPNPPSSANFFLSFSTSLLVEWIICVIVRRLSECLVTGTSQRTIIGLILMSHFQTHLARDQQKHRIMKALTLRDESLIFQRSVCAC